MPVVGALGQAAYLPAGATVTVSCPPKRGFEGTLRLVNDEEHLEGMARRLSRSGVREIFAIGGDVKKPPVRPRARRRSCAAALAELRYGFGRRAIGDGALREALRDKQRCAD